MAKIVIRSGHVVAADLGLNLQHYPARAYQAEGLRVIAVQNAKRNEIDLVYSLANGKKVVVDLISQLGAGKSARSIVVVAKGLGDEGPWTGWTEKRLFDGVQTRPDGSRYPVLRAAITLPSGSAVPVTHIVQIVARNFVGAESGPRPKANPDHGDDIEVTIGGTFRLFAGAPAGPLEKLTIDGIDEFDHMEISSNVRPSDPANGFPPG